MARSKRRSRQSALVTVLKALVPYSQENLMLSFHPNRFFNELEGSSRYKENTLKDAYWRARREGLVEARAGGAKLTSRGLKIVRPFIAEQLGSDARLMVIFDIPESDAAKRQQLRSLLKEWGFKQAQKSVWVTDLDYKELIIEAVSELGIGKYVELYESMRLFPKP